MKRGQTSWRGALLIVAVFLGVVGYGLIYGMLHLQYGTDQAKTAGTAVVVIPTAPTVEQYRYAAGEAMGPFVRLAFKAAEAGTVKPDETVAEAAMAAKEAMLDLTVPKEERDAHLEAVLLLEQWIRAMDGSRADAKQVAGKTFRMVEKRPWLYR